jgi:hypothetical protein
MSQDPDARPANARALAAELEPFGDRKTASAPDAPTRRRLAFVAATVLAVTLVVLLGLRRSGDARPTAAAEPAPAVPSGSAPAVAAIGPDVNETVPTAASAAPAAPSASVRVDAPTRPRPRPARPAATTRPSREADDRIE